MLSGGLLYKRSSPFDELFEVPVFVVNHPEAVVNGQHRHPGCVALVDHIRQQLWRQQKVLRPDRSARAFIQYTGRTATKLSKWSKPTFRQTNDRTNTREKR